MADLASSLVRLWGNTAGAGTGVDYAVLVNAYGELLTASRAVRATLLDNAAIAPAGVTSAAQITTVGHTMFVQIVMDDVGEFTVISSPDNVTYYEQETICLNDIAVGGVVTFRPAHEFTAVRNDSPDTLTGTIILGAF